MFSSMGPRAVAIERHREQPYCSVQRPLLSGPNLHRILIKPKQRPERISFGHTLADRYDTWQAHASPSFDGRKMPLPPPLPSSPSQ